MSITFEIVKFKKPTKDDLSNLHMFNPYGSIPILDDDGDSTGWNIYMFRADDKDIQNIINSSYWMIFMMIKNGWICRDNRVCWRIA